MILYRPLRRASPSGQGEVMIKNDRQYLIAVKKLRRYFVLRQRLAHRPAGPLDLRPRAEDLAKIDQLTSALQSEIDEFDSLVKSTTDIPGLDSVGQIPLNLIRARIAVGWSQRRLAEKCNLHRVQIWRFEKSEYRWATLETLMKVSAVLASGLAEKRQMVKQLEEWLESRQTASQPAQQVSSSAHRG